MCTALTRCRVVAKHKSSAPQGVATIDPTNARDVNSHAISGDGSPRAADFTKIRISGVGGSLRKFAHQKGSTLNNAIRTAISTGETQGLSISGLSAGGSLGGSTDVGQDLAIGHYSVNLNLSVTADHNGNYSIRALVTGVTETIDYNEGDRNPVAEGLTTLGRELQEANGGNDYDIIFYGEQEIEQKGGLSPAG